MKTFESVRRWLSQNIACLTSTQLDELESLIKEGREHAAEMATRYKEVAEQAQALAKSVGANSIEEILRVVKTGVPIPVVTADGRRPRTGVRKPYLNPLTDDGMIHPAPNKNRPRPEWLIKAEAAGYTLEQCHHEAILDAWRVKGVKPLYADPTAIYKVRAAAEPVRFQRRKKQR